MPYIDDLAVRLADELQQFAHQNFGCTNDSIEESPHVLAFLEYCADGRDRILANGHHVSLRRNLPAATRALRAYLLRSRLPCPIGEASIAYADMLEEAYGEPVGATPVAQDDVIALLEVCDDDFLGRRARALIHVLWATWARPSELLRRTFPDDIYTDDPAGVAIVLTRSKMNRTGRRIEYLPIAHATMRDLCPVCELHAWTTSLGTTYRGPLFPILARSSRPPTALGSFSRDLDILCRRIWGRPRFSPYSFRHGGANAAALAGWPSDLIRQKLRHESIVQSLSYIRPSSLYDR